MKLEDYIDEDGDIDTVKMAEVIVTGCRNDWCLDESAEIVNFLLTAIVHYMWGKARKK